MTPDVPHRHPATMTDPPPHRGPPPLEVAPRDALPEHNDYRDDGCDVFPSCLRCPLPRCRYDEPGGVRALLNRMRDEEIRRMRRDLRLSADEIARRFHISRRTVYRVLSNDPARRTGEFSTIRSKGAV